MSAEVRPVETRADRELALRIHNEVLPKRAHAIEDVLSFEESVEHTQSLLGYLDGEPAGASHAALEADAKHPFAMIYVLAGARKRGVGGALLERIRAWAKSVGADALYSSVEEADEKSLAWALRRGFIERGRESRLVLELARAEPPAAEPPPGIEIATWADRPDATHGMYEVFREVSPDIPGEEDEPIASFEEWRAQHMGGPGDRPEATFVALAGDEVVGYSKFSLTTAVPDVAFHDLTGVKRAWRGKGIAGALKATQIRWAKEHGYARLSTMNEERNEPIRRLNERYGYRPEPGRVFIVGPLAP